MKKKDTLYSHVLHYTGVLGGVQGFGIFMSFIRNKFAAIFIGSAGLGYIDIYNRTTNLFSAFTSLITPIAAVRSLSIIAENGTKEEFDEKVRIIRSLTLFTSLFGFFICSILSPLISQLTFGDYIHWKHFVCLSPIVPMIALCGTELSILKATRNLRQLALASCWSALALGVITIPFYITMKWTGIVPALVLSTFATLAIELHYTLPICKWKSNPFSISTLKKSADLVKLSLAYIVAGIVATGSEVIIRFFINNNGDIEDVGLYSSALILIVAAGKFLLVTMDADFYPRLSAQSAHTKRINLIVNKQIEVSVLLVAPFLIIFDIFSPLFINLLYTPAFLSIVPMVVLAAFYMFFKGSNLPIAYIPLAKGNGKLYLLMESLYYTIFTILVVTMYHYWGLVGTGIALSLSNFIELLYLSITYHKCYQFILSKKALEVILFQGTLLTISIVNMIYWEEFAKYIIGCFIGLISFAYTIKIFSQNSSLKSILRFKIPKITS